MFVHKLSFNSRKTIYFSQIERGCHVALLRSDDILRIFVDNGYKLVSRIKNASVILIDTCTVISLMDKMSQEMIEKAMNGKHRAAIVVVSGCYAQIYKVELEKKYKCLVTGCEDELSVVRHFGFPLHHDRNICRAQVYSGMNNVLIKKWRKFWRRVNALSWVLGPFFPKISQEIKKTLNVISEYSPESYFLRISDGCVSNCTYCAIKNARGEIQSRPLSDIAEEMKDAIVKGFRHIVLSCDDFTSYGLDLHITFIDLLKKLFEVSECATFTIRNFNPNYFMPHLNDFLEIARMRRIKNIELWLQSGSNSILKRMERGYTKEEYMQIANSILAADPQIALKTGIMIGFPGETEDDFDESIEMIDKIRFLKVEVIPYCERPNTVAVGLADKVPPKIVDRRIKEMSHKFRNIFWERIMRNIGVIT